MNRPPVGASLHRRDRSFLGRVPAGRHRYDGARAVRTIVWLLALFPSLALGEEFQTPTVTVEELP